MESLEGLLASLERDEDEINLDALRFPHPTLGLGDVRFIMMIFELI